MKIEQERRPHAALDGDSRVKKALKIETLLSSVTSITGARVLEVGTGAGYIAAHFGARIGPRGEVHAVDVIDQRRVHQGFVFQLVRDTKLPFADETFDICISNHVLEHVGGREVQVAHLRELRRVLTATGWLYLAVPNRWTLIEPHFKLPLLSWLPRAQRDQYVRLAGRGDLYDCDPPSHAELEALLQDVGLDAREVSFDGIKAVADLEHRPGFRQWLLKHPKPWAKPLRVFLPSHLYLARRSEDLQP